MSEYDDAVLAVAGNSANAQKNLYIAAGQQPEKAAEYRQIGQQLGVLPSAVEFDPDGMKALAKQYVQENALSQSKPLQDFVGVDPTNAMITQNDLENLANFSKSVYGTATKWVDDAGNAFDMGWAQAELGKRIAADQLAGRYDPKNYEAQESYLNSLRNPDGLSFGAETVGSFLGGMWHGVKAASYGAAMGATAGAAAGGVGAVPGAGAGLIAGFAADAAMSAYGSLYRSTDAYRGPNGEQIPEYAKIGAATLGAVINGGVQLMGGKLATDQVASFVNASIMKAISQPGTAMLAARAMAQVGTMGLEMGALNMFGTMGTEAVGEVAKHYAGGEIQDPLKFSDWLAHGIESAASGFALGAFMAMPAAGKNFLVDRARVAQYQAEMGQLQQRLEAAKRLQTYTVDPETAEKFIDEHLKVPPVKIAADAVAEMQANGGAKWIDADAVKEAQAHGGDVEVPAGKFYNPENADEVNALAPHIRTQSGLNAGEAAAIDAIPPESYIQVFHGSGALFDKFNDAFIGTGEGAQAYGHGHYVTEEHGIAQGYYEAMTTNADVGFVYEGKEYHPDELGDVSTPAGQEAISALMQTHFDLEKARAQIQDAIDNPVTWAGLWTDAELAQRLEAFGEPHDEAAVAAERARLEAQDRENVEGSKKALQWLNDNHALVEAPPQTKTGAIYTVNMKVRPERIIHLDEPVSMQPKVDAFVLKLMDEGKFDPVNDNHLLTADAINLINALEQKFGPETAKRMLQEGGFEASKYIAAGSRRNIAEWNRVRNEQSFHETALETAKAQGNAENVKANQDYLEVLQKQLDVLKERIKHNYVVYDPEHLEITHVNGVEVPKEVRDSPESILIANETYDKEQQFRDSLFLGPIADPKALAMNKDLFRAFSKSLQEQQASLAKAAFDAALKEKARVESKLWKENLKDERQAATDELTDSPQWRTDRYLRGEDNPLGERLDKQMVDALYTEADFARLGIGEPPSGLLPKEFFGKGGPIHDLDSIAAQNGFNDAKSMIDALIKMEQERQATGWNAKRQFNEQVEAQAQQAMKDKYGSIDDKILQEALEAAISVKQLQVLINEFNLIAGDERLTLDRVQGYAEAYHGKMDVKNGASPDYFVRLVQKYGDEALKASLKGDTQAALFAKQRQAYNLALLQEARAFQKELRQGTKMIDRYSDNIQLNSVDQRYTDRVHEILDKHGFSIPRDMENLADSIGATSLEKFVQEQQDIGFDLVVNAGQLLPKDMTLKADRFKVEDFRDLAETVKSFDKLGKDVQYVITTLEKVKLSSALDKVKLAFDNLDRSGPKEGVFAEYVRGIDASMLKMEQMLDWIDNDPKSPLQQAWNEMKKGIYKSQDLRDMLTQGFKKAPELSRRGDEVAKNDWLLDPKTGAPKKLTFENAIHIALNMGNEGNKNVLLKGMKWEEAAVKQFLHENLTAGDLKWVQHMWDTVGQLWPHLKDAVTDAGGVAPPRVKPSQLELHGMKLEGGYWPLIRDRLADKVEITQGPYERALNKPLPMANSFKERTGAVYPLELTDAGLAATLRETTHAIGMHVPVREAWKIIGSDTMKNGVIDKFGVEYWKALTDRMRMIANDGGLQDLSSMRQFDNLLTGLRSNAIIMAIGFRPDTAFLHGANALLNSIGEVARHDVRDAVHFFGAVKDITASLAGKNDWLQFVHDNSGEFRNRGQSWDRDLQTSIENAQGESMTKKRIQFAATAMVYYSDLASVPPLWLGVYRREMAAHGEHDTAVQMADKAIRQAHGSASIMDRANIQDAKNWKLLTAFYGTFNHIYNRLRDISVTAPKELKESWETKDGMKALAVGGRLMSYVILSSLLHEWLRGHHKEDEGFTSQPFQYTFKGMTDLGMATLPVVRDVWFAMRSPGGGKVSAIGDMYEAARGLSKDFDKWKNDDLESAKIVEHGLQLFGYARGLGSKNLSVFGQDMMDRMLDNPRAYDEKDWWKFLYTGGNARPAKH